MPTHSEKRIMPYTAQLMYDLIADVDAYPQFLPWCSAVRINKRKIEDNIEIIEADMVISFKVFRERFGSRVSLRSDEQKIDVEYLQQIFYGKEVVVNTFIESIGTKSFVVFQEVWQSDQLAAKGHAVHVWFDYKQQSSCPIPGDIRAALSDHLRQ